MQSPVKFTWAVLVLVVCAVIFLDYWTYSQQFYREPGVYTDVLRGTGSAPAQYRIGVVFAASFIARHGHIGLRHAMTVLDAASAAIAVCLLYGLLHRSAIYQTANNELRWFGSAALVVLVQFTLLWLPWYQRPETLPTAGLLACTVWLLSPKPGRSRRVVLISTAALLMLLAAAQALVRADVVVALHLGVLVICLSRRGDGFALPRPLQAAVSIASVAVGGGVQWYMMHVYPHATYGTTPVLQLVMNLTSPQRILPFILFMVPSAWMLLMLVRRSFTIEAAPLATLAGGLIFLAIWCVMGKIDEVRIFLPFALALVPLTAQLAMKHAAAAR